MPYVSHNTPKIDFKDKVHRRIDLDADYIERIDKRIAEQIKGGIILREEAEKVASSDAKFN